MDERRLDKLEQLIGEWGIEAEVAAQFAAVPPRVRSNILTLLDVVSRGGSLSAGQRAMAEELFSSEPWARVLELEQLEGRDTWARLEAMLRGAPTR